MSIDSHTLKALREKLNLKQKEMAEFFGIVQASYSQWELGKVSIPNTAIDTITEMAKTDARWDVTQLEERYFDRPKESESTSSITSAALEELRSTLEFMKAQIIELQEEKRWMRSLVDSYKMQLPLGKTKGLSRKDGIVVDFLPHVEAA